MILTGQEIEKQIADGGITINPFDRECIGRNSYTYHISNKLLEIEKVGDIKTPIKSKEIIIPEEGFLLEPHKLYLGTTKEIIGSKNFVTSLVGRNKIGKLGMFLQITADIGQLGQAHNWTLEIAVIQKLKIYPNMEIGKLTFWLPKGKIDIKNVEYYSTHNDPQPSKLFNQIQQ